MNSLLICMTLAAAGFAINGSASLPPLTDSSWMNLISTIVVEGYAGNGCSVGCGFDGTYIWVTNGAEYAGTNPTGVILLFEENGNFVTSFDQNEAPGWGLRDLCCNDQYMFGSYGPNIDYYDLETHQKVGSFIGPLNPNRALAFRSIDNSFFTGNFGSEIYRLTWDGISGSTASSTLWSTSATCAYGAAWDLINGYMWVTSADGSGTVAQLDFNGNLIDNYYPVPDGVYGGAAMGSQYPANVLWVLEQCANDRLLGFDLTPSSLQRDTWGSIKSMF